MSHTTRRYTTKNTSLHTNCDEAERDVLEQRNAVRRSLRAASEPILSYPQCIVTLKKEGRDADLGKLDNLVESIAKDTDSFSDYDRELAKKFEELKKERPTKKAHLARYYNRITSIGYEYLALNEKILSVTTQTAAELTEIIHPSLADNKSE